MSSGDVAAANEVNRAGKALQEKGVDGFLEYLRKIENSWKSIPLNIAVIGNSGVGKSSFINAIRGLTADDDGAAAVGETETTIKIKSYTHPRNPLMVFWDLPGVGTSNFPKNTYVIQIDVKRYDFFLLLSATRFTENDVWLAEEVEKLGKKYFYVRTKIAVDVSNNRKAHPTTHNADKVISDIRRKTVDMIEDKKTPVFLIDSYKTERYDFNDLVKSLLQDFPELKRSALVMSMTASSEHIVRSKVAELRLRIWRWSLASAVVAAVPVPGVSLVFDVGIVLAQVKVYKDQLGLDEESLKRFSKMKCINPHELKSVMAHPGINLTVDGLKILAQSMPAVAYSKAMDESLRLFPVVGSLIASPLSYHGTKTMLNMVLDQMEEAAIKIVKLASESMAKLEKDNDDQIRSKY